MLRHAGLSEISPNNFISLRRLFYARQIPDGQWQLNGEGHETQIGDLAPWTDVLGVMGFYQAAGDFHVNLRNCLFLSEKREIVFSKDCSVTASRLPGRMALEEDFILCENRWINLRQISSIQSVGARQTLLSLRGCQLHVNVSGSEISRRVIRVASGW